MPIHGILGLLTRNEIGLENSLNKSLEYCWHVAAPERKDQNQVVTRRQRLVCYSKVRFQRLLLAIAVMQNGIEIHLGKEEQFRVVAGGDGRSCIGLADRLAERRALRVSDNNHDSRHRFSP